MISEDVLNKIKAEAEMKCSITIGLLEHEPGIMLKDLFEILDSHAEGGKKISRLHESDDGKPEYIDRNQIEWYECNLENCPICKENDHDCGICNLARCYARQIRELPTVNLESEE